MSSEEKVLLAAEVSGVKPGLLAASLYAAMENNKELRDEAIKLQEKMKESEELIERLSGLVGQLNAKIALLNTLQKHSNGRNPAS